MTRSVLLLISASILWSFVGVLVKSSVSMVDSHVVSFLRFAIGVLFLLAAMIVARIPFRLALRHPLVWLAALGKSVNYVFENLGLSLGPSWGNLVVAPVSTLCLAGFSFLVLREEFTRIKILATLASVTGILLMRIPTGTSGGMTTGILLLMVVSGIGAAVHLFLQKKLAASMSALPLNASVFLVASLVTALPLPATGAVTGHFQASSLLALLALGGITGLSFLFLSWGMKGVSLFQVTILTNLGFLLSPLWAWTFRGETVGWTTWFGALLSIGSVILAVLPVRPERKLPAVD